VINPDLGGAVHGYNIALGASETELQVAEDNISDTLDAKTRVDKTCQSRQYDILRWLDGWSLPPVLPTPMMDVLLSTSMTDPQLSWPEILITPPAAMAAVRALQEETVTPAPLPPPVVPAPYPTNWSTGALQFPGTTTVVVVGVAVFVVVTETGGA